MWETAPDDGQEQDARMSAVATTPPAPVGTAGRAPLLALPGSPIRPGFFHRGSATEPLGNRSWSGKGTTVLSELNRMVGKPAFCALRKGGHSSLKTLGDQRLALFGNRVHDFCCLVKRSRNVEVGLTLRNYSRQTQHVEDVALGEVGLGADAVKLPLCRRRDVAGPRSLGDGVEQIG